MKTMLMKTSRFLVLCLAMTALLIPSVCLGQACNPPPPDAPIDQFTIASQRVLSTAGAANNPSATEWGNAQGTVVPLTVQVIADVNHMAAHNDTFCPVALTRLLNVKAIHDGTTMLFRIEFADATENILINDPPRFHDALAIGIPYPESLYPGCVPGPGLGRQPEMIHMGNPCNGEGGMTCCPMNLMFWRSDKAEIENIVSNGPGTTKETYETDAGVFTVYQNWTNGTWTLVLGRVMNSPLLPENNIPLPGPIQQPDFPGKNLVDLVPGQTVRVIFANWDGAKQERNGIKFIGLWGNLSIAP